MTSDPNKMSCAEFQAQLPDLIGSGADAGSHPHVQNCELCRALLADLETIAEAARRAVSHSGTARRSLGAYRVCHQERRGRYRSPGHEGGAVELTAARSKITAACETVS